MPSLTPIFLAGPTAVGKSAIALQLAELLAGEIISVDSMQVYRGLDIGTAKPSAAERVRVPHHLIDVADLSESFDAARFIRLAQAAREEIQARGRVPIFCGGTGLYFKAFLDGLGQAPPADPQVRGELENIPLPVLLTELEKSDPVTFGKIDRQNPRRVIRALEVIRLTGKPFSVQRSAWSANDPSDSRISAGPFFVLTRAPGDLQRRIDLRVEEMFRRGLVSETEFLLTHGLEQNRTAMQAIGYRQVVEHLSGERSLSATSELVKVRTKQFAKRQLTWFRRHARAVWITLEPSATPDETAAQLAENYRATRLPT
ncbi:MAG: tRNA (adenosine(37)-N6)-dimethylallyltransferase MiaA [Verrucomicrobia bacterium]|nr:tRNA (adenosine(37)-N6)-dimethylallyltransferase MiaA [Verrucomicrobiota bacterium]